MRKQWSTNPLSSSSQTSAPGANDIDHHHGRTMSGDEFGSQLNPSFTLPQHRSAPSSPARNISKPEAYHEIFRYKVVYPGGTFVRISPAMDAEKTGDILDFGTVFEASKSLFLDGTNYAKLSNGSGWVFDSKHGIEILELLEVVRIPIKSIAAANSNHHHIAGARSKGTEPTFARNAIGNESMDTSRGGIGKMSATPSPLTASTAVGRRFVAGSGHVGMMDGASAPMPMHAFRHHQQQLLPGAAPPDYYHRPSYNNSVSSSSSMNSGSQTQQVRSENRVWRDVRARCGQCGTFEEFQQLSVIVETQQHQHHPNHFQHHHLQSHGHLDGPVRSAWTATGDKKMSHHDLQVRGCIALIASITRQCSAEVADQESIEACLWVLVHMGSRVAHVMTLIVDAANNRFEAVTSARQGELLR